MKALITHVRSEVIGNHAHIGVWNRGAKAGTLVVSAEDGVSLCCRLVPRGNERTDAAGGYSRWALAEATVRVDGVTLTQELQDRGHDAICQAYAEAMGLL